jgi:hypothetical protein
MRHLAQDSSFSKLTKEYYGGYKTQRHLQSKKLQPHGQTTLTKSQATTGTEFSNYRQLGHSTLHQRHVFSSSSLNLH